MVTVLEVAAVFLAILAPLFGTTKRARA